MARLTAAQKAARAAKAAETAKQAAPAAVEAPATRKAEAGTNTRSVVVVCKMPRGLYLQIHSFVKQDVRVMGGGVESRTVAMRMPEKIRLKPTILPFGMMPNYVIESGFSINPGIPADFWRQWLEQNQQLQLVTEGMIAGFDDEQSARSYCREFEKKKTGLEPIAQQDDPRIEKTHNPNLTDIDVDTDSIKAA